MTFSYQVKSAVHTARDALPDKAELKTKIAHAKEQVEEKAHALKETVKDALPHIKSEPGESSNKTSGPTSPEPVVETVTPAPSLQDKYKL